MEEKRQSIFSLILGYIAYFAMIFIIALLLVKFVGQRTVVHGTSMVPTLENGDNLIADKVTYRFREPERFEIIVFPYEYEEKTYYIKRIIGLPGETVYIDDDGNIWIDGEILEENYGSEPIEYAGLAAEEIVLGEDEYFCLGDNRGVSKDSRYSDVGNIKRSDIIGRTIFRIWPLSGIGPVGK